MLTKTLTDRHYGSREELCMAVAGVLRSQLERIPAEIIQLDEANITGHPEESDWAAACAKSCARWSRRAQGSASVLRQLRRTADPNRYLE